MAQLRRGDSWNAAQYGSEARYVSDLGAPLIDLLSPGPGQRILDVGCGDGALTEKLVATGCSVVGIDSSPSMVAAAGARGLDCRLLDASKLTFEKEFDGVFSNAALHWVLEPDDVIAGVARALKPGGKFVGEFGGGRNVKCIVHALTKLLARHGLKFDEVSPWYFPSDEEYRDRLESNGFRVDAIELFDRPTLLPGDIVDWLKTFAVSLVDPLDADHEEIYSRLREDLREDLWRGDRWFVDYVRLRFVATLS
jgi:trans-aconitate methyltransferase